MGTGELLAKNTRFMLAGEVISRLLSFFLIILITRFLGDYGLGLYSFAFAFTGLLFTFSDFGFSILMLKEIGCEREKARHYLSNVMTLKALLLLIMVIASILFIATIAKSPETKLAVGILTIAVLFAIRGLGKTEIEIISSFVKALTKRKRNERTTN